MKIIGMMAARNEAWCLRLSLDVALRWVDHLIVLDHASDDATPDIISNSSWNNPDRITHLHIDDPAWSQSNQRRTMLDAGRRMDGTHFAVIDADEILALTASATSARSPDRSNRAGYGSLIGLISGDRSTATGATTLLSDRLPGASSCSGTMDRSAIQITHMTSMTVCREESRR
jgi:hypothetical protein